MECAINEMSHHVDASHQQVYSDLDKVGQLITEALQSEVQRNAALRLLIHRLEERVAENRRSLSEQVESNRQLRLQVDELQKQLEDKDNSLTQAEQSVVVLKTELEDLQQQLQSPRSNHRTVQEETEWLQNGNSQPTAVKEEDGQLQYEVFVIKEEEEESACDGNATEGYQCSQSGEIDTPTEQTTSSSADIKAEPMQEEEEILDMAPVISSEISQSPPHPVCFVKSVSVQLVDCCETQSPQGTANNSNINGEIPKTGKGEGCPLSSPVVPESAALPKMKFREHLYPVYGNIFSHESMLTGHQQPHTGGRPQHCTNTLSPKTGFIRHQQPPTGENADGCIQDGQLFSQEGSLGQELRMHAGEKPHLCKQCGKTFSLPTTLRRHQRTHTGEKPYACDECGKTFSVPGTLSRHQRTHTGERPFACRLCGKLFSRVEHLRRHEHIHTREEPEAPSLRKPYDCKQCGKRFSCEGYLRQHLRIHTEENLYTCEQCGKPYSSVYGVKRHQCIHTGDPTIESLE